MVQDNLVENAKIYESPNVVSYRNAIYCFYHGSPREGILWYSVLRDGRMTGNFQVPSMGMSGSPGAVVYNDKIYVFHQGLGDNHELWYNVMGPDGSWEGDKLVAGTWIYGSPAAVVYDGHIYVFFREAPVSSICFRRFQNGQWSEFERKTENNFELLSETPCAFVHEGAISICYKGYKQDFMMEERYNLKDKWLDPVQNTGSRLTSNVGAVSANGKKHYFHQGCEHNGQVWYGTMQYSSYPYWSGDKLLDGVRISQGPSAAVLGNQIYCFHQGSQNNGELWYFTMNI